MATCANIIVQTGENQWSLIYTHYDGYPSHMGVYLDRFHNNQKAAKAIVKLGDMSQIEARLAPATDEKHTFDEPAAFCSTFFGRDRDDKGAKATRCHSLEDALANTDNQYVYVWQSDGWWFARRFSDGAVTVESLTQLAPYIDADQHCVDMQTELDNKGKTLAWRDAGCPHEVEKTEHRVKYTPMPIGYRNPAQVRADRYAKEALF